MTERPPPHYTAFRLVLAAVVVATLAVGVWWVLDTRLLVQVVDALRVR